ncbi:MAG: nucleotidyltransferase domain-containing protein [Deltaproteobacteria bacterium]|nr:nucleotidyltransferase domain-containing protein [Deltaproteobacteria bacterium]
MARVRKPKPTLDVILFSTPEQKVIRFLLSQPTTAFTPRVISSKLKGVRGLGGSEGITQILLDFQDLGLVEFVDNQRAVRMRDDSPKVQLLKTLAALSDLEGLRVLLEPISQKGVLFGCRATGKATSESDYELLVVSESPDVIKHTTMKHPIGRQVELITFTPDEYTNIANKDPDLHHKLSSGILIWGSGGW